MKVSGYQKVILFFSVLFSTLGHSADIFPVKDPLKHTQIVATLGPSSGTVQILREMIINGMNVARINASHGDWAGHTALIKNVRKAASLAKKKVYIMVDLQGPKIRVDKLAEPLNLKKGEEWIIVSSGDEKYFPKFRGRTIPTVYRQLVNDAAIGKKIMFDDGYIQATAVSKITEKAGNSLVRALKIKITTPGKLKSNKGINLPGSTISAPSLTEKDKIDLKMALQHNADAIALSFVRSKKDIDHARNYMKSLGIGKAPLVAKMETPEAMTNMEEIVKSSDALMVARGDLGVEVGYHRVPVEQRRLINMSLRYNKTVITATQMLESMIRDPLPTRAEADNVAHAVWQKSSALMLSGESAVGKHPAHVIKTMTNIIRAAEANSD